MATAFTHAKALLRDTFFGAVEHDVVARGAGLAYYVLFSLGPLLLLLVIGLQLFLAQETVRDSVLDAIASFMGVRAAATAETVLEDAPVPDAISWTSLLTAAALVFGATAVFANVRGSLNAIWGTTPTAEEPSTGREMFLGFVIGFLRTRWRGFVMLALTGLILTFSFVLTYAVSELRPYVELRLPFGPLWTSVIDTALSIGIVGLLFAMIFRTLPERRIAWSAVWVGGYVTALLFVVGKVLIARLIANVSWTSYYGPGTSVVAFMLWVYLSAQVFFLGAEFTHSWAERFGPSPTAEE